MQLSDIFEGFDPGELSEDFDSFSVEKLVVSNSSKTAELFLILNKPVAWKKVRILESKLNSFFCDQDVTFFIRERYELEDLTPAEVYLAFRESFFDELKYGSEINKTILDNSCKMDFSDEGLSITLRDTFLDRLFGKKCEEYFKKTYSERFGKNISVTVDYSLETPEEETVEFCDGPRTLSEETRESANILSSPKSKEEKPKASSHEYEKKAAKDKGKFKAKPKLPPDPNLIFGRNFDGAVVPVSSIQEEVGEVVITGKTQLLESKELNYGKVRFTFSITDFTDTIKFKLFLKPEEAEEFNGVFKDGDFYTLKGIAKYDTYDKELEINSVVGLKIAKDTRKKRMDNAPLKRVELHAHTKMSDMDAVTEPKDLVLTAFNWGHKAVAITDHGVVQGFTDAFHAFEKMDLKNDPELKKKVDDFKVIYGCEGYIVDDVKDLAVNTAGLSLDAPAVAISLLTDGTDSLKNNIVSAYAVDCSTRETLGASSSEELKAFLEFLKGKVIFCLKPDQDINFLREAALRNGLEFDPAYIDADNLARMIYPDFQSYKIGSLAKELKIKGEIKGLTAEAGCLAELHDIFIDKLSEMGIERFEKLNSLGAMSDKAIKSMPTYHIILLCMNDTGRVNLYRLISLSHLNYFNKRPRIPKSLLMKYREGILVGSACEAGELFRAVVYNKSQQEIDRLCRFYDYFEVQPIGNNSFMIEDPDFNVSNEEDLRNLNRRIIELGEKYGKLVVATSDEHFLNPDDSIYRSIIMAAHGFKDADRQPPLYLHTTEEMLEEFSYLGDKKAYEIVVENSNKIADMIEKISPVRPDKCPPVIKDSDKTLEKICYDRAHSMYGDVLPPIVEERLKHELNSIISNGFAVMYIIAQKLVWKSNEDGYLVGSRGSVGSSFVATMAGITEVNPLPPHYYCGKCHYSDFDSETVKKYTLKSGFDMPDATCPICGAKLIKDGNNIPFETFLGFNGDKEPDIDLNFSGEYQSKAHAYTEVIFGEGQTFRAGTVSGVADKTAYAETYKYFEEHGQPKRRIEIERLAKGVEGVKKTTGQHPGGIIVLPYGENIYSFTPVQHPANDPNTNIITTHFDYHSIDHNLLKLDILGHDDPTMIRMLQDITGVSMNDIPMDDEKVLSLFQSPKALGLDPADIEGCPTGTLGLPELGTDFVIQMLVDTKPSSFSDLIRISGLSHGTNVWLDNTQTLIREGKCTLATAICTRDDIMVYLISKGIEPGVSFKIMESVRKGKGLNPDWEKLMTEHDVPDWYIWSCKQIKYMFPKAHACAYIMMALRIAWFKVYRPLAYYAAYFSIRAKAMNYATMCRGEAIMLEEMNRLKKKAESKDPANKLTPREDDALKDMKIVLEMYRRGFEFTPIDIFKAKSTRFQVVDNKLMPCLNSIDGLGENAAMQIEEGAKKGKFLSVDDFKQRCKVSQTVCDNMYKLELLGNIPKSNQISLMDLFGV